MITISSGTASEKMEESPGSMDSLPFRKDWMAAIWSSAEEKSISGNRLWASSSVTPLSSSDWIWVSRPMYSIRESSSIPALIWFSSSSSAGFSLSVAVLNCASLAASVSISLLACWISS